MISVASISSATLSSFSRSGFYVFELFRAGLVAALLYAFVKAEGLTSLGSMLSF